MKDIAPNVFRQRALIEAKVGIKVTKATVRDYLKGLPRYLKLKTYGGPVVYSAGSLGKPINQGSYDGFVALIESGISISAWAKVNFVAILVHTCKKFDVKKAAAFTKKFFKATNIVYKEF